MNAPRPDLHRQRQSAPPPPAPAPEPLWQSALAVLGTVAIIACLVIFAGGMER